MAKTLLRLDEQSLLQLCAEQFGLEREQAIPELRAAVGRLSPQTQTDYGSARIRKIKLSKSERTGKERLRVDYMLPTGDEDWREFSQTDRAEDLPPEFLKALEDLVPQALEILELESEYGEGMKTSGVSLSYSDDEANTMTVVLTLQKTLSSTPSPFVLNTPAKPCTPYGGGDDDSNCVSVGMVVALETLLQATRFYLSGQRSTEQLSLLP